MKKMILSVSAAMALVACSSGGGGSGVSAVKTSATSTASSTQNNSSNNSSTANNAQTQTTQISNGTNFFARNYNANPKIDIAFNGGTDFNQVTVNGVKVNLAGNYGYSINSGKERTYGYGISSGTGNGGELKGITAIHTSYSTPNVVYGILRTDMGYASFYNGKETAVAQIPASGKVDYVGQYLSDTRDSVNVTHAQGTVIFSADFGSKKLTGAISDKFQLEANIKGNKFESAAGAATSVKGGFFGTNAAQIGGVFQNGDTVGAFGAQKK